MADHHITPTEGSRAGIQMATTVVVPGVDRWRELWEDRKHSEHKQCTGFHSVWFSVSEEAMETSSDHYPDLLNSHRDHSVHVCPGLV